MLETLEISVESPNKQAKIDSLINLGQSCLIHNPANLLKISEDLLKLSKPSNHSIARFWAIHFEGCYFLLQEKDNSEAKKIFEKNLLLAKKLDFKTGIGKTLTSLGLVCKNLSMLTEALDYYFEALVSFGEAKDQIYVCKTYVNISAIYFMSNKNKEALEYHKKSLPVCREIGDKEFEVNICNNIGLLYKNEKNLNESLNNFKMALSLAEEINYKSALPQILVNIGFLFCELNDFREALFYFQKAKKACKKDNEPFQLTRSLVGIAEAKINLEEYNSAKYYLHKALKLAESQKDKQVLICMVNERFYKLYQQKRNFKKALKFYKIYSEQKHKLTKTQNQNELSSTVFINKKKALSRIAEITRDENNKLNEINAKLNKLSIEKKEFLETTGNELKIPIEKILFKIKDVQSKLPTLEQKEMIECFKNISEEVKSMDSKLKKILEENNYENVSQF